MSNLLNIKTSFEFFETETDGSKCVGCEEVIIGKMYQVVLFINNEPVYSRFKYCEHCYEIENEK